MLRDGFGADRKAKAEGVRSGDQVEVDNDAYLAYCYWHRHHVINGEKGFDQVLVDGNAMFPQRPRITVPSPFGGHYSAQFKGKLLYMQHTHDTRSEEHTSELQSLMRISYAVFCLKKKKKDKQTKDNKTH